MNTKAISNKLVMGAVMASLIMGAVAFTPFSAHAEVGGMKTKKAVDLTCMQTAVDTREDAVSAAFTGFNEDVMKALAARKTALHDAWGMSDKVERQKAIKTSWTAWKTAKKSAHTDLKTDRKKAWETFKTTAKISCKEVTPKEEGLEKDAAGTIAL
ncbi:MAG: hypothetical protein RLZZ76_129 [Candidatus Parcubacteria bacterium]|jgi:hypothetical protein